MQKTISLLASFILLAVAASAQAQVERITLRVDGLACPFCAYGLEKKVKKLEGPRSFNILINEGKVILQWKADEPVNLQAIYKAVDKAGFTLRGVRGSFSGRVRRLKGRLALVLPPPADQRFFLYELAEATRHSHAEPGERRALTKAERERLQERVERRKLVNIQGPIHGHKDPTQPYELEVAMLKESTTEAKPLNSPTP